jgi:acetyltransferase
MTFQRSDPFARNRVVTVPAASTWLSPDGAVVTIRATRPDDASIAQDFVRELSPQARYCRFMGTVRELTPQMLRRFVRIDHAREVALVAVATQAGRTRQLGECRYALCPGGRDCEFAVAVLDAWQRRGLGQRLMSNLIAIAHVRGLRAMIGEVFATNTAMLGLALKLGFRVGASGEGWSVRRVSLALSRSCPGHPSERTLTLPARALEPISKSFSCDI